MVEHIPPKKISIIKRLLLDHAPHCYKKTDYSVLKFDYKIIEDILSVGLGAKNIALEDGAFDAIYTESMNNVHYGLGFKTFVHSGYGCGCSEKISEHDSAKTHMSGLCNLDLARAVSQIRNERLNEACIKYTVEKDNCYYISIVRTEEYLYLAEERMEEIDIDNIKITRKTSRKGISFSDGKSDYNYNYAKSTLLKNFRSPVVFGEIYVDNVCQFTQVLENKIKEWQTI